MEISCIQMKSEERYQFDGETFDIETRTMSDAEGFITTSLDRHRLDGLDG